MVERGKWTGYRLQNWRKQMQQLGILQRVTESDPGLTSPDTNILDEGDSSKFMPSPDQMGVLLTTSIQLSGTGKDDQEGAQIISGRGSTFHLCGPKSCLPHLEMPSNSSDTRRGNLTTTSDSTRKTFFVFYGLMSPFAHLETLIGLEAVGGGNTTTTSGQIEGIQAVFST